MKTLIFISFLIINSWTIGQIESEKVYNFRTDYYYDSTVYESLWSYYVELNNNKIYKSEYPIVIDDYEEQLNDSTIIKSKRTIKKRDEPYSYLLINDTIFIKFVHYNLNIDTLIPQFKIAKYDTIRDLLDANYFHFKSSSKWLPRKGYSIYLGPENLILNNREYSCLTFKIEEKSMAIDKTINSTQIVYLENNSLLLIKVITTYFDSKSNDLLPYHETTYLDSTSMVLPDFKTYSDLTIWKDTSLTWNSQQKNNFINKCPQIWGDQVDCACIMKLLNGSINYYESQLMRSSYMKYMIRKAYDKCE